MASRELCLCPKHQAARPRIPPTPGTRVESPQARSKARALGLRLPGPCISLRLQALTPVTLHKP